MPQRQATRYLIGLLILLAGLLPILAYQWILGRVPTVRPEEALQLLNRPGSKVLLVDVREEAEFEHLHVAGSRNWPLASIAALASGRQIPPAYHHKTLLLIDDSGLQSSGGVERLRAFGLTRVYNVRGGLQEWAELGRHFPTLQYSRFAAAGRAAFFPCREMSPFEQFLIVFIAFAIKPLYMLLSPVLAWVLRQSEASDLVALRRGIVCFFLGEAACAVNFLFYNDGSYLAEYLHSLGMVLCFAFVTYALLLGLDQRLIRFSVPDKRCAALELCGTCRRYQLPGCAAREIMQLLAAVLLVLCFLPLLAPFSTVSYNSTIWGNLYNFSHPVLYQWFEYRYCPAAALLCGVLALLLLTVRRAQFHEVHMLLAAGIGAWGFSLFRLIINSAYRDQLLWANFWEEITELLFMAGVAALLWLFRRTLFNSQATRP